MVTPADATYRLISDHQFAVVRLNLVNNQKGFFARRSYTTGELIAVFSAKAVLSTPSYLTVQTGINKHILLQPDHLQYINHSCDPNVFFDTFSMEIIALRDIADGDEMTFFYPSTEWDMAQPFTCHCGSAKCLHEIGGAAHIPQQVLETYTLTRFIQQQLHDRAHGDERD